jgi:hypothetical protein
MDEVKRWFHSHRRDSKKLSNPFTIALFESVWEPPHCRIAFKDRPAMS